MEPTEEGVKLVHASFFSGEGGFDLAAEWAGWDNLFHCEINPFCQRKLKYYWPKAISHANIKETDFTIYRGRVDVLSGGFPCQPYSVAGKRLGKEDDRHLWPEMLRGIREIQPPWVVGENVRGLINWNRGMVFDEVQADLEALGYEVTPFILPACAVNAPHRRDRVWFVAYSEDYRLKRESRRRGDRGERGILQREQPTGCEPFGSCEITTDTNNNGLHGTPNGQGDLKGDDNNPTRPHTIIKPSGCCDTPTGETITNAECIGQQGSRQHERPVNTKENKNGETNRVNRSHEINDWRNWPTQPGVRGGDDGLSDLLDPAAVFEGIDKRNRWNTASTYRRWREESIKAHGNAIVPQVAYEIFKVINTMTHAASNNHH